jgi:cell division protein FtsW (lipid II flippase)
VIPSPRRTTELGLLLLGAFITVGAYVLASLGRTASLPANIVPFLVIVLGLLVGAHVTLRWVAPQADSMLLPLAGLLNGLGYVMVARLDQKLAGLQALWTAVGVAGFVGTIVVIRRVTDLERYRYTFALGGIGLLMLPLAPSIGRTINGSRLWVRFGTLTFQPGELAKIALAVFFASYLVERRDVLGDFKLRLGELPKPRYLAPILLAWAASLVVMIAERDLGSSLLFFALFVVMLWVATARPFYLGTGGVLFLIGSFMSYSAFAHVKERVTVWIDPWSHASGSGFQIVQALFALGTGGVTGVGLGLGSPQKIPAATTDMIYSAFGEELGLLGTVAILVAFLLMVGAGLRVAARTERPFEQLLATGLTVILGVQTFIIVGGVLRVVPLTGVTLPFVSYGGSSLLGSYILLALLLRISHDSNARLQREADETVVRAR